MLSVSNRGENVQSSHGMNGSFRHRVWKDYHWSDMCVFAIPPEITFLYTKKRWDLSSVTQWVACFRNHLIFLNWIWTWNHICGSGNGKASASVEVKYQSGSPEQGSLRRCHPGFMFIPMNYDELLTTPRHRGGFWLEGCLLWAGQTF